MIVQKSRGVSPFDLSVREILLVVIITFPVIGTMFPLDTYLATAPGGLAGIIARSPLNTTVVLMIILAYVIWLFAQNLPRSLAALRRNWLLFVFLLWSFATSRWAADSGLSFNRTGRLLVFTLYAIYIVEFIPYRRSLQILGICLVVSCLASLALIAAVPSLSYTTDYRGAWRGAMMHKNIMGGMAAMTFFVVVTGWRIRLFKYSHMLGAAFLAILLLLLANSATALLSVFAISVMVWFLIYIVNRVRHPFMVLSFVGLIGGVAMIFVLSSGIIFTLLGRDASLTGRAEVWEFTSYMIDQKPFWGWGNSTWSDPDFKVAVLQYLRWPSPNAHNGWLDFRLQLGLPGFVLAIAIWIVASLHIVYAIAKRRIHDVALPIAIFMSLSIRSYSETVVVDPSLNEMFWLAFSYASLVVLPTRERAKRRMHKPRPTSSDTMPCVAGS